MSCNPVRVLFIVHLTLLVPAASLQAQTAEEESTAVVKRAVKYLQDGKPKEAAPLLERGVELYVRIHGADDARTLQLQGLLGETYFALDQFAKALPLYERSMAAKEKLNGKNSLEVAHCLCYLGFRYVEKNEMAKAEDYLTRGLKIWDAFPEAARREFDKDEFYPAALSTLGTIYRNREEFTKAITLLSRAQKFWDGGKVRSAYNVVENLGLLADLYTFLGEYDQAEPLFKRAVRALETGGEETVQLASVLKHQGHLFKKMGQFEQAESVLHRSLKIYETKQVANHPDTASCLQELGSLYRHMNKFDEAADCYARGLKMLEAKYGKDGPELFFILESMAVLEQDRGELQKAVAIRDRTLKMAEAKFGPDSQYSALVLVNRGNDFNLAGDRAKAEASYARALKIREARLGADHPETASTLYELARLQASDGRWDEAWQNLDRVRRVNRRYVAQVLPGLSEAQQLTFLEANRAGDEDFYDTALALAVQRAADPKVLARSAEWLLNKKAVLQQALAERGQQALAASDPEQSKLLRQLTAVRGQLAGLSATRPVPGQEETHRKTLRRLADEEQDLAKRLGQAMGRPKRDDPWVGLDEVQRAIPEDAVLVEVAEMYLLADVKDEAPGKWRWGDPHFMAWVIPARGEVKLVDLGTAVKVEKAVAAVRQAFNESAKNIRANGEAEAEKELRQSLDPLAKLILEPLLPHIGDKKNWIISPDTDLWLVPWAALPLKDGSYACEKYTVSHIISGRDLVAAPLKAAPKSDGPLIMADPDFDVDPKEAAALTAKLLGKSAPAEASLGAILDAPSTGLRALSGVGRVSRLPGTAAEALAIKPKLQAYSGEAPWVYRGKNALEGVFKAFRSPKVVVLSTHGFFLEAEKGNPLPLNPLLRCGLLLAGCNERGKATDLQNDGVLTGLEIVSSDLRGTELVVLSACETGVGDIGRASEGVAGLRQAFQLAGASAVVASLWQVSDRDTALLMNDFFDELTKGKSKAEALRTAQCARMAAHRDRNGAAHPFFWAAFTYTGKPR